MTGRTPQCRELLDVGIDGSDSAVRSAINSRLRGRPRVRSRSAAGGCRWSTKFDHSQHSL